MTHGTFDASTADDINLVRALSGSASTSGTTNVMPDAVAVVCLGSNVTHGTNSTQANSVGYADGPVFLNAYEVAEEDFTYAQHCSSPPCKCYKEIIPEKCDAHEASPV